MGKFSHGIPKEIALELRDKFNLKCFVETGTHVGATAIWASSYFSKVITVESSYKYYCLARDKISTANCSNVLLINKSSVDCLQAIIRELKEARALFFLDAHWSRDLKIEKPVLVCPALIELEIILRFANKPVIIIDDARLFDPQSEEADPDFPTLYSLSTVVKSYNALWMIRKDADVIIVHGSLSDG